MRYRILVLLPLAIGLSTVPVRAELEVRIKQSPSDDAEVSSLVVRSQASGRTRFSISGVGAIRSGWLVAGASKTYSYAKTGILQYRVGTGADRTKGVLPLDRGRTTEVLIRGTSASPMGGERRPAPSTPRGLIPPSQTSAVPSFQIKNPFGPAFEQLSTPEQIRLAENDPAADKLEPEEKGRLLAFLYNKKGVEESHRGLYAAAEESLLTALKGARDEPTILKNLAYVVASDASEKGNAGDFSESEAGFKRGLSLARRAEDRVLEAQIRPTLASLYVNRARELSSPEHKKRLYKRALEQDPSQPVALFEMGQIAYADYDLEEALEFFEAAYRGAPQIELGELIEKVKVEIEEAGDFVTKGRGDFTISFEGREADSAARLARKLLNAAVREVGRNVGGRPDRTIPVVIYGAGQFQQILGLHSWAGGAYDGKIRLPIADLSDDELRFGEEHLSRLIYHEYTHALLRDKAGSNPIPIWFHEGVAQLAAGEDPSNARIDRIMTDAILGGSLPPPSEMSGGFSAVADPTAARVLYAASFSFVEYLVEELGGWSKIRKVVDRLGDGKPMAEAIQATYRKDLVELENAWLRDLERR